MSERPDTGRKFSFSRLLGPKGSFGPSAIDLRPLQADLLVSLQLRQANPKALSTSAFSVAQIVATEANSAKIHAALIKSGILFSHNDDEMGNTVDTSKITRNFAHELAFVSVAAQKRIVALLFFWEDECERRRGLEREEAFLNEALTQSSTEDTATTAELQVLSNSVRLRMNQLPSQRAEATSNVGAGVQEELPTYAQQEETM